MLTSRITNTLTIPGEPTTVTIRKLSHRQISEASDAKRDAALAMMKALEGVKLPDENEDKPDDTPEVRARKAAAREAAKNATPDPANSYDRATVLRHGVTSWTYDAALPDALDDLDEETAAWLFGEIIAFSLRGADEGKASANGSRPSTDLAEAVGLTS